MKKKSKIIIIVSTVILIIGIAIPTSLAINKSNQIKNQQAPKIADANTLKEIAIVDKAKANKLIADKKMAAKKIATEKLILAKIEATRIANKKIKDEKLRLTRIANAGLTLYSAKRIALKLRDEGSFTPLYNTAQWISGHWFYVFSSNDPEGKDDGSDWRLCIDKTTKKAYMHYSNNKLVDFGSDYTPPKVVTTTSDSNSGYIKYYNKPYDLSISYPSFLTVKDNSATSCSVTFSNNDRSVSLMIGESINNDNTTPISDYQDFVKNEERGNIIYKNQVGNYWVSTFTDGGDIYYTKEIVGTGSIVTYTFSFPINKKDKYIKFLAKIDKSFVTPSVNSRPVYN